MFSIHIQVDVLCGYKETESLVDELMKMKIPDYKPTSNHVHISDRGWQTYALYSMVDLFCFLWLPAETQMVEWRCLRIENTC